ncbi:TMEM175 family protein [Kibdelosporangium lantanae]
MTEPEYSTLSDTVRAEAFSDAVLSIVITLLVLDLKPPPHEPGRLLPALIAQWPTYLAYVTSYLYIAVVWLNHKAAFQRIQSMTRGLHWANLLVLFTTALLPWPTSIVASALAEDNEFDARVAAGLYTLVGSMLCLSFLWFFHVVGRHPDLLRADVEKDYFPNERIRAVVGAVVYLVAGVTGVLWTPVAAMIMSLVVPVFYAITSHGYVTLPDAARHVLSRRKDRPR